MSLVNQDRVIYNCTDAQYGYPHMDGKHGTVVQTTDNGQIVFVRFDFKPSQFVCYDTELTKIEGN